MDEDEVRPLPAERPVYVISVAAELSGDVTAVSPGESLEVGGLDAARLTVLKDQRGMFQVRLDGAVGRGWRILRGGRGDAGHGRGSARRARSLGDRWGRALAARCDAHGRSEERDM